MHLHSLAPASWDFFCILFETGLLELRKERHTPALPTASGDFNVSLYALAFHTTPLTTSVNGPEVCIQLFRRCLASNFPECL